jgi:PAS domain S-box-containing protein
MRRTFRDVPIRRKLTLLMLLASTSGVLLTGAGLSAYAWSSARAAMERDLASVSSILANNATGALAFRDLETANEILSAIRAKPELESGCLYIAEGVESAALFASVGTGDACPAQPGPQAMYVERHSLVSVQPVVQAGERIGWLRLRASLAPLEQALAVQAGIMLAIVLVSIAISVGIAFAMQRVFSGPILRLAETARQVSQTRNYGLRVQAFGRDEVGVLVQDFNAMLDQIARADAEIKRAEERFRLTVEAAPNAMLVVAGDGLVTLVNTQTERLFGYSRGELVGQPVEKLVPARFRDGHPALRKAFVAQPSARSMGAAGRELFGLTRDGREVPIEVGLSPIETPDGTLVLSSVIDITERKLAESAMLALNQSLEQQVTETARTNRELGVAMERLKDTQAQLVQAEKLASLGALVAGVAHEINTPVGVGVTAASALQSRAVHLRELLQTDSLRKSDLDRFVAVADESTQIILRNLQRAASLIHSFKQVAVDQSSGERRRFALKGYIDEVLLSLRPRLKATSHAVEVECAEDVMLDSYPGAIAQILTNLVTNSLIHGFDGLQNGHVRIAILPKGDRLTLKYSDDGRGIPAEHLSRVFDPFFTTKRGIGGSGLGLHIVYNLVTQLLGGTIQVISAPGQGASFLISLPVVARKPDA